MTYGGCCGGYVVRRYYTRAEKREWLQSYADGLKEELQAVQERIQELQGGGKEDAEGEEAQ